MNTGLPLSYRLGERPRQTESVATDMPINPRYYHQMNDFPVIPPVIVKDTPRPYCPPPGFQDLV
jgi:hypothetical protein